jgi:hypothetical protein
MPRHLARRAPCLCALLLALTPAMVSSQARKLPENPPIQTGTVLPGFIPGTRVNEADLPLFFSSAQTLEGVRARRAVPPLEPAQALQLRHATDLRNSGLPERALDTLAVLQRAVPHHPYVIAEMARDYAMREAWQPLADLLRSERGVQRDSLLSSNEYVIAYERLGRPRDASVAAIETWIAAPSMGDWAMQALRRAALADPRVPREALRAAVLANPRRTDLARGLAHLYARAGEPAEAVHVLESADSREQRPALRQLFAEVCMSTGATRDSIAAIAALASLAGDTRFEEPTRIASARRAWGFAGSSDAAPRAALALSLEQALRDLPPGRFPPDLALALARELRTSGHTAEARHLLDGMGVAATRSPELLQEAALGRLREGPPERALGVLDSLSQRWPPARFAFAEAQFFAAHFDSALAAYQRIAADPEAPDAGAALERTYLLEEQPGAHELRGIATLAWQRWRGDTASAARVADSLFRVTPVHSHYAATIALQLAELRADAGDWKAALIPLAMVNDSLPDDRLAPVARQRTGEAYLQLQQPKQALAAFEECLARFPRAWNAPEVRRRVERLRREMRL